VAQAFVYTNGALLPIAPEGAVYSSGAAINASGHVAGCATIDGSARGFVYRDGAVELVPATNGPENRPTCAVGISDDGHVVGCRNTISSTAPRLPTGITRDSSRHRPDGEGNQQPRRPRRNVVCASPAVAGVGRHRRRARLAVDGVRELGLRDHDQRGVVGLGTYPFVYSAGALNRVPLPEDAIYGVPYAINGRRRRPSER
jgi:hypothetical protein